jgi:hypothetical protein
MSCSKCKGEVTYPHLILEHGKTVRVCDGCFEIEAIATELRSLYSEADYQELKDRIVWA